MPASFKNFWKKTKKNKRRGTSDVINTVIEEARDEELEVHLPNQIDNTVVTASSQSILETTQMTTVHDASVEIRDDIESSLPSKEEPSEPPVSTNQTDGERSETQDDTNASRESTTENNSINRPREEERVIVPKQTKQNAKAASQHTGRRAAPLFNTYNNGRLSPTYSQGSSDSGTYSWNDIYIRDNESVSVLTKDFKDANIMDVLSLDAVMEVVNKGIIIRENGEAHLESDNLKDEDSTSGLMNCLWNTFDCCGDNSLIAERQCYMDRCHRGNGGYGRSGGALNDDGKYLNHHRKSKRISVDSGSLISVDRIGIPENVVEGKSVSWADDTVDNIVLEDSLNEADIVQQDKISSKQDFISGSNSSDGKESKVSVRSAVKSSFKNMKNIVTNIQTTTGTKQPVDAKTVLEEHRNTMKANKNLADTTNRDNQNWRDTMNDKNDEQNWRAAVNDRLNYQGPSSPASLSGNLSPGMYSLSPLGQQQQQWDQNPLHCSDHLSLRSPPSSPIAMTGRIPSMGNRPVAPEMNMSMSIDSDDVGDKYGMECDEDALRPRAGTYAVPRASNNGGVQYDHYNRYDSPFMQESAPHIGNHTISMMPSTQQPFHNRTGQPSYQNLHSPVFQQNFQSPMTNNGMIQHPQPATQGYATGYHQSISDAPLSPQRRTFMA